MADDTKSGPDDIIPANDNQCPDCKRDKSGQATRQQLDQVALSIARLIGRRMAREHFRALIAANDNRPRNAQNAEDGADKD